MTSKGKAHTYKRNEIIDTLIDLRLNKGYSREGLRKLLMEEPYSYSSPAAYEYVASAAKEFEQRAIVNFGDDLKEDIERFETDRYNALQRGDFKLAVEVLKQISELKGHYVKRVDVNGDINHFFKLVIPDEDQIDEGNDSNDGRVIE